MSAALKEEASALAQKLVDHVATVTQLDPEKGELPNVEDWHRNAEALFAQVLGKLEAAKSVLWMAKEYAEAGGSGGPEMRDYNAAIAECGE